MKENSVEKLIDVYKSRFAQYESCAYRMEALLKDLLKTEGIKAHFTESRAKKPESLLNKLLRPDRRYDDPWTQIPDLVGIRIVLYYQDDVAKVGELIRKEFEILEEERSHQPDRFSPDQFGYISMHYVVCIGEPRACLPEWRDALGVRTEVQIRTVLQHAWASVSHALQYKREGDVPVQLRRRLFRLAGLFELADEQFISLRNERDLVVDKSRRAVLEQVPGLSLDAPVVSAFIKSASELQKILTELQDTGYVEIKPDDEIDERDLGAVVEELERLEVATIEQLTEILQKDFTAYFKAITADQVEWTMSPTFALLLVLIGSYPNQFSVDHLCNKQGWGEDIAESVIEGAKMSTHF